MDDAAPDKKSRRRAKPASLLKLLLSRTARQATYNLFDNGTTRPLGLALQKAIIALILITVAAAVLQSVPEIAADLRWPFLATEIVVVFCFTLEYVLRVWSAVEDPPYRDLTPWHARLKYVVTPGALIDLLAIAPFYLAWLGAIDVRVLLTLRLLRFLKLTRYSPGMRSLVEAIHSERKSLLTCLMFLVGVALIGADFMHWAERDAQPDKFGTIPEALYWAVITLATVGYGDVVPITVAGKVIASVTAVLGLFMLSLPIGILASSFAQVIQRRDFVVTWSMVARVPLFNTLSAAEILEIMRNLNSMSVEAGEVIVRKGDLAQSMYFIASGAVTVEIPHQPVQLGEGHFFGEMALLKRTKRSATVRAVTRTKLLVLDSADLHNLMEQKPEIGNAIEDVARQRAAGQDDNLAGMRQRDDDEDPSQIG
ncbi:cyclic nucleotide-gated ion channel [Mesorhizobium sp. BAC0120]|uniref:cyclic nucleotide-gated ion channel n=1 Tax=Mesorhizobium sp. BAC0120 TaxID=3090670 RepID=UPI00298CE323|nr:cyclic nucleotide-gated ion channel [Mesorhizobium sp. BAC0120]MDW6026597.1 cyclic nucleotide-gated ion channel [Mesorhizobium sp. BAC0120]